MSSTLSRLLMFPPLTHIAVAGANLTVLLQVGALVAVEVRSAGAELVAAI